MEHPRRDYGEGVMGKIIHDKPQGTAFRLAGMPDWQARATAAEARIEVLEKALRHISLGSQNSSTTKEHLGREARAALKGSTDA
jgi:hypothetical protein